MKESCLGADFWHSLCISLSPSFSFLVPKRKRDEKKGISDVIPLGRTNVDHISTGISTCSSHD